MVGNDLLTRSACRPAELRIARCSLFLKPAPAPVRPDDRCMALHRDALVCCRLPRDVSGFTVEASAASVANEVAMQVFLSALLAKFQTPTTLLDSAFPARFD